MSLFLRSAFRFVTCSERIVGYRTFSISTVFGAERKYTKKHEWISFEGEIGTVGITDFAAEQLGDVVFVELPDEGTELERGQSTGAVESVKAASDVYAPISGTVIEKNIDLEKDSSKINKSPFEQGYVLILIL
uniref:Glycine cleavage system H protein n=1 Tax=Heterorhabditis bacteriophora TaxID=37862 RepID=A0A1I7XGD3_HETBA